jgi:hypothetical protein
MAPSPGGVEMAAMVSNSFVIIHFHPFSVISAYKKSAHSSPSFKREEKHFDCSSLWIFFSAYFK